MFKPQEQKKTTKFVEHIELLARGASGRQVFGFQKTEYELLNEFITDTKELLKHMEFGVAVENLITNLYEIEFKVDSRAIDLAKEAIKECGMKYEDWKFIEELQN